MKLEINTSEEARNAAKALRSHLKTKAGMTLGVGHSQEVLSAMLGLANWDTLKGVLGAAVAPQACAPVPQMTGSLTLYVDAYACDAHGDGPTWARIVVDNAFLQELAKLRQAAKASGASEIRSWAEPDAWDGEHHLTYTEAELVVSGGAFWFTCGIKHCDYRIETRGMDIEQLHRQLQDALTKGDQYLLHAPDISVLKERLDDCDELLFCDECGAPYQAGGDGYDGKCPSCADAEEEGHGHSH